MKTLSHFGWERKLNMRKKIPISAESLFMERQPFGSVAGLLQNGNHLPSPHPDWEKM